MSKVFQPMGVTASVSARASRGIRKSGVSGAGRDGPAAAGGVLRLALVLTTVVALSGCATDRSMALSGQASDIGTTAVGLAMGAAEANPLGILALGAKAVVAHQIEQAPPDEQPGLWRAFGAFGWGATANNLCVIASIACGGGVAAAVCPLIGLATGLTIYSSKEPPVNQTPAKTGQ